MMIPGVELITRSCATAGAEVSAVAAACWPLVARYLGHVLEEVDEELAALRHAALRVAGTATAPHNFRHPLSLSPQGQEEERTHRKQRPSRVASRVTLAAHFCCRLVSIPNCPASTTVDVQTTSVCDAQLPCPRHAGLVFDPALVGIFGCRNQTCGHSRRTTLDGNPDTLTRPLATSTPPDSRCDSP
eukprot:scaffold117131_cov48-Phaeocystis_antarctica.AAC.2